MNKEQLARYIEIFTIEKREFSYFSQKLVDKKYKLYTKPHYLPPKWRDILNPQNGKEQYELYRSAPFSKDYWPIWFAQLEVSEEVSKRFADNIKMQKEIMRIITKRDKDFNYRCGIIKARTWSGKTHIIMEMIQYTQAKTLILVSNKKLLKEMIDQIGLHSSITPSQYWWGKKEIWDITVMTKKSFCLDYKVLLENNEIDFDVVLVDECHQNFTQSFRDAINISFHERDIYLYWLSATPSTNELDQEELEMYYWKTIDLKKDYDFIPHFTFYNYQSTIPYEFETYPELRTLLAEDEERKEKQLTRIYENLSDKCSLILCDRVWEIEDFYNEFDKNKYAVIKITWETKVEDDTQQLNIASQMNKPIIIVWSIQKCATWFNYPIIDTVFLFSAIRFQNTTIQSIGRSLRKAPWKTWADVYIWNDKVLDKQRLQKLNTIVNEYWINKASINNIYINKQKSGKSKIAFSF